MAANTFALLDQIGIPYLKEDGQPAHGSFADQLALGNAYLTEPVAIPCPWDRYVTDSEYIAGSAPIDHENLRYVITSLLAPTYEKAVIGLWWSWSPTSTSDTVTITIQYNYGGASSYTTVKTVTIAAGECPKTDHWWLSDAVWDDNISYYGTYLRVTVTGSTSALSMRSLYAPPGVIVRVDQAADITLPTPHVPQGFIDLASSLLPPSAFVAVGQASPISSGSGYSTVNSRRVSNPSSCGSGWPCVRGSSLECSVAVAVGTNTPITLRTANAYPLPIGGNTAYHASLATLFLARANNESTPTLPRIWSDGSFYDYLGFTGTLGQPSAAVCLLQGYTSGDIIGAACLIVNGFQWGYTWEEDSTATFTVTDTLSSTVIASGTLFYDGAGGPQPGMVVKIGITPPADGTLQRLRLDIVNLGPGFPLTANVRVFTKFAPPPWAVPCIDGTIIKGKRAAGWMLPPATASLPSPVYDAPAGATSASGIPYSALFCRFTPPKGWYQYGWGESGVVACHNGETVTGLNPFMPATGRGIPFIVWTGRAPTATITPASISRPDLTLGATPTLGSLFRRFVAPATGVYRFTFQPSAFHMRCRAFLSLSDPDVIDHDQAVTGRPIARVAVSALAASPPAGGWWGLRTYAIATPATGEWAGHDLGYASCYGMGSVYEWGFRPAEDGDVLQIAGADAYQLRDGTWDPTPESLSITQHLLEGQVAYLRLGVLQILNYPPQLDPLGTSIGIGEAYLGVTTD